MKKHSVLSFFLSYLRPDPSRLHGGTHEDPNVFLRIDGAEPGSYPCTLRSVGSGQIHLHSQKYFEPGTSVTISFGLVDIPGAVLYSNRKESAILVCVTTTLESRGEPRFPMNQAGRLIVLADNATVSLLCTIVDLSRSGIGLQARGAVTVGQMACVETEGALIVGEVRGCEPFESGRYRIGLRLTDIVAGKSPDVSQDHSVSELIYRFLRKRT
jgi:hypothetical protein